MYDANSPLLPTTTALALLARTSPMTTHGARYVGESLPKSEGSEAYVHSFVDAAFAVLDTDASRAAFPATCEQDALIVAQRLIMTIDEQTPFVIALLDDNDDTDDTDDNDD